MINTKLDSGNPHEPRSNVCPNAGQRLRDQRRHTAVQDLEWLPIQNTKSARIDWIRTLNRNLDGFFVEYLAAGVGDLEAAIDALSGDLNDLEADEVEGSVELLRRRGAGEFTHRPARETQRLALASEKVW